MTEQLYHEDLPVGRRFVSSTLLVEAEEVVRFARAYDPQPFHTDDAAAQGSIFKRLAASGWHTAAMSMRLIIEAFPNAGGVIGAGLDELRWPKPVYPGDTLRVEIEVLEERVSRSSPTSGWVKLRATTFNQHGEPVLVTVPNIMTLRRPGENT